MVLDLQGIESKALRVYPCTDETLFSPDSADVVLVLAASAGGRIRLSVRILYLYIKSHQDGVAGMKIDVHEVILER
jgi:hypothetical protein